MRDAFEVRLRRPEYTGENRCLPCTAANVAITVGIAALAGLANPVAGAGVLGTGLAAIYLRGYLVPGTPTLTARYLPVAVLELFGKEPILADALESIEGTAVRATPEGGRLVDSFETAWHDRIAEMRRDGVTEADMATLLGVKATEVSPAPGGETAYVVGNGLRQWLSESALIADAAAGAVLDGQAQWAPLDSDERRETLRALRAFLDTCPACGGTLEADETETIETCCADAERVLMATCVDCETRLMENRGAGEALAAPA
jgi:hypothetical protein